MSKQTAPTQKTNEDFRQMCRQQLRKMSDQAIRFQLTQGLGGIQGEERQREAIRRGI